MKAKDKRHFQEAWMAHIHPLALLFLQAGRQDEWEDLRSRLAGIVDQAAERSFPEKKAEGELPNGNRQPNGPG